MERGAHNALVTMGARAAVGSEREKNDYYATPPEAVEALLAQEKFCKNIWEAACGAGHIAKVLEKEGYTVYGTDLIDRGYGRGGVDFLRGGHKPEFETFDIITNPPYGNATDFVVKALETVAPGRKVAMLLKLTSLAGKERRKRIYDVFPLKTVYVFSGRVTCAKGGDFRNATGYAIDYAWFVWEKGYSGTTAIRWI